MPRLYNVCKKVLKLVGSLIFLHIVFRISFYKGTKSNFFKGFDAKSHDIVHWRSHTKVNISITQQGLVIPPLNNKTVFKVYEKNKESVKLTQPLKLDRKASDERNNTKVLKKQYFITSGVFDIRRFGNLLFTYASLLGIAHENDMKIVLRNELSLFEIFNCRILKSSVNSKLFSTTTFTDWTENKPVKFDNRTGNLPYMDIQLRGYFQSFKYMVQIKDTIKQEFSLNPSYLARAKSFFKTTTKKLEKSAGPKNATFIGIHVRRGDITTDYMQKVGFVMISDEYIVHSMEFMRQKYQGHYIVWIVASDDIPWCQKNIRAEEHVVFLENNPYLYDFAILTRCHHVIMSTGTFGWWAAWLSGGTVIYYKDWPRHGSHLSKEVNTTDFFPPYWIGMV